MRVGRIVGEGRLCRIKCTVTTSGGKSDSTIAVVGINRLNKLSGNGLTGKSLYDLAKRGRCSSTDPYGTTFVYELLPLKDNTATVEQQEEPKPFTDETGTYNVGTTTKV